MLFFEEPRIDLTSIARGGDESSFDDIWAATDEDMRLGQNAVSRELAIDRSFDTWIDDIKTRTGAELRNPLSQAEDPRDVYYPPVTSWPPDPDAPPKKVGYDPYAVFRAERERLAEQHPEHRDFLLQDRDVTGEAGRKTQSAQRTSEDTWDRSNKGAAAWAARIGGGFYGAMHDPLQWATLAIGGGGKAAQGVKGLLWMGLKQSVANAVGEASIQPFVQQWRRDAGVDHGLDQAAENIAFAGAFGFAADFGARGVARGIRRSKVRP